MPLTRAYASAVAQFRSLRSERDIARKFALLEIEHLGISLGPSQVERTFEKEQKALDSWARSDEINAGENAARKRWKAIVEREGPPGSWTRGQEYVRLWQEGIRPTYSPLLKEPKITPRPVIPEKVPLTREQLLSAADFMGVVPE